MAPCPGNLSLHTHNLAGNKIQIRHQFAEWKAMVLADTAAQHQFQLLTLASQRAFGVIGQPTRICAPVNDAAHHGPAACVQHIAQHVSSLMLASSSTLWM